MSDVELLPLVVAVVAAFVLSGIWYGVLSSRLARLHDAYAASERSSTARTVLVELARNTVVVVVVAGLAGVVGLGGPGEAVVLGLALWLAFPVVLLAGSVFHEQVPPKLAAVHGGDWLLKLLAITVIVGSWG